MTSLPGSPHSYLQTQRARFEREIIAEREGASPDQRRIDRLREFQRAIETDFRLQNARTPRKAVAG
jgi:hypothetical protein